MKLDQSQKIFQSAADFIPGGVNSPVRAYKTVGGTPPHIVSGKGAIVRDEDGNEYVDMVLSYGPLIVGHTHPSVTAAINGAAEAGTAFGAPTSAELELAREICDRVAACEMVRLVNSGTEATMSALRLARAVTGRDRFLKFNGCYHGHGDSFLVKAGSGALTHGAPDSPGVPASLAELTMVAEYNDLEGVRALFQEHGSEIACIFVEPVAGNMGCVLPAPGFLEGLRALCDEHGALLIFDEVMTGFRVARGGYEQVCGVSPDLVTLGKVIGGGLPIGAYGGRKDLMQRISPVGDVYQAGTLSGNPLAVSAGRATLALLDEAAYTHLEANAARLESGLQKAAADANVPVHVGRQGSMLCLYFTDSPVTRFDDVMNSNRERWNGFFQKMLAQGILLPPSPFEAWFLSTAHDDEVVDRVVKAVSQCLRSV